MDLRLQKPAFWASLHLRSGLRDWDMASELALGATCDQLPQDPEEMPPPSPALKQRPWELEPPALLSQAETVHSSSPGASGSEVQPHLWMWVNPSLVCPIPGHASEVVAPLPLAGTPPSSSHLDLLSLPTATGAEKVPWEGDASQSGPVVPEKLEGTCGPPPVPQKAKVLRFRSRKLKRTMGGWPRPPLNYCILISLALSNSADSSLTVQEIYQFTRHHFPFFRTAPEGWKNTVRHNLCFSSSFEKTTDFVCLEGNRKSRLWKLTTEGRRKFQEEVQALPEDMVGLVHQSMDKPELLPSLFSL